jgi:hypothetical protein
MVAGWIAGLVIVGLAFAGFLRLLDLPKIKQKREQRQRQREYEDWNATHGL